MPEPKFLDVFVYGHYDSRGGTAAIAAKSREEADKIYNKVLFSNIPGPNGEWVFLDDPTGEKYGTLGSVAAEDFLWPARLEYRPGYPGTFAPWECQSSGDLESDFDSDTTLQVLVSISWHRAEGEFVPETLPMGVTSVPLLLWPGDSPPPESWVHPRWDDDAYGFVLISG